MVAAISAKNSEAEKLNMQRKRQRQNEGSQGDIGRAAHKLRLKAADRLGDAILHRNRASRSG